MTGEERDGVLIALAGFATMSLGDGITRSMAGEWSPLAIAALRFGFALVVLAGWLWRSEGRKSFRLPLPGWQALRGVSIGLGAACFFTSLTFLPLAEATAITFTSPLFAAVLAAWLLGEPLRLRTWIAIAVALIGVELVLRPNVAAFGAAALLPLGSAAATAVMIVGNRKVAGHASPLAMQFGLALFAAPLLVLFALIGGLEGGEQFHLSLPDASVVLRCLALAGLATTGHALLYLGTVRAGAALVAPMTYVQLLLALAIGWAGFGEIPDVLALVGAALIAFAGLFLLRRDG